MGKNNNIIEINGQKYDARSGALLGNGNVDGFSASTPSHVPSPALAAATPQAKPAPVQTPSMRDVVRSPRQAAQHAVRQPQQTHTLMRHVVKKPAPSLKSHTKVQGSLQPALSQSALKLGKPVAHSINNERLERAHHVSKNQSVKRFHTGSQITPAVASSPVTPPQRLHSDFVTPSVPVAHRRPAQTRSQTTADLLQHALAQASSHQEPAVELSGKPQRKQFMALGSAVVVSAALLGFFAFHNITNVRLQIASSKAGFTAAMPAYKASGFRQSSLEYFPGIVSIGYSSNSDNRTYTVLEKSSEWDSASLRDDFVVKNSNSHQTVQSGGRTIFLYGDGNATWVNAGVWYQVQSAGALSNRQLIDLATSL